MLKKLIFVLLLLGFFCGSCVYAAGSPNDLGEAIAKVAILPTTSQFLLYTGFSAYYMKFNRWPHDREEFIRALGDKDEKKAKDLSSIDELIYYKFSQLENGDLLIEGGFNEKITAQLTSAGFGKCLFSVIAHKSEEGFSFEPSPKNKDNRDYFTIPLKFKVKKDAENK